MSSPEMDYEKQQHTASEKQQGQATVLHGLDNSAADGTVHR